MGKEALLRALSRPFSRLQDGSDIMYKITGEYNRLVIRRHRVRKGWLPETEGAEMAETDKQDALLREIQTRLDRKLKENELTFLEYWKEQLDAVTARKPEGVAALQTQVRKISEMMANRIRTLKRG